MKGWSTYTFPKPEDTAPPPARSPIITSMHDAIVLYKEDRELFARLDKQTTKRYEIYLKQFPNEWPLTEDHIRQWARSDAAKRLSAGTLQNRLILFRAFWKWLRANKHTTAEDPSAFLPTVKQEQITVRIPTTEEVAALLRESRRTLPWRYAPPNWRVSGVRLETLIAVLVDTAMRIGEAACSNTAIRWQDVNIDTRQITVRYGKGKKTRLVPIEEESIKALRKWRAITPFKGSTDYVFPTSTGMHLCEQWVLYELRRLSHRAGLDWAVTPHRLRHYAATEMARAGINAEALREILGHRDLRITQRYLHLAGVDISAAHRRTSPLNRLVTSMR